MTTTIAAVATYRPPWLAATCLLAAVIALAPPEHRFAELAPMGSRPPVFAGEQGGPFVPGAVIDPGIWIPPNETGLAAAMPLAGITAFAGDPHIFLSRPSNGVDPTPQHTFVDTMLSGLWKLFAPAPS